MELTSNMGLEQLSGAATILLKPPAWRPPLNLLLSAVGIPVEHLARLAQENWKLNLKDSATILLVSNMHRAHGLANGKRMVVRKMHSMCSKLRPVAGYLRVSQFVRQMSFEHAYGAVFGAFVGDAAGAVLEFAPRPDLQAVEYAMHMPGGGVLRVGAGQITDDSELALCLAHALVATGQAHDHNPRKLQSSAADMYIEWLNSEPFDLGMATRNALSGGLNARGNGSSKAAVTEAMVKASADRNMQSKANGALMRITPLPVWAHQLSEQQLVQAARADAQLTHPNQTCQDCNACYCIAIAHLIRHPGDAPGAVKATEAWASKNAVTEVQEWLADSEQPGKESHCQKLIGFVKWGFTYAFRHLRLHSSFSDAISNVLLMGGDTDTNAAIVGGMIGAMHGANGIPDYMKKPVLARGAKSPGRPRPAFLATDGLATICQQLFQLAGGPDTCQP